MIYFLFLHVSWFEWKVKIFTILWNCSSDRKIKKTYAVSIGYACTTFMWRLFNICSYCNIVLEKSLIKIFLSCFQDKDHVKQKLIQSKHVPRYMIEYDFSRISLVESGSNIPISNYYCKLFFYISHISMMSCKICQIY